MTKRMSLKERLVRVACDISNRLRDIEEINVDDVQKQAEMFVLIDVRPLEERAVSMIPGAVTAEQFEAERNTFQGRIPVAYCTAGYRSGVYAQELNKVVPEGSEADEGHDIDTSHIRNLRGGILSWCQAGLSLTTPDGKSTREVHVYSKAWNLLPEGYRGVW